MTTVWMRKIIRIGVRPVLTEVQAGVTIRWWCEPPPVGPAFRVTIQKWNADFSERNIYEWELIDDEFQCDGFRLQVVPWRPGT